MLNRSLCGPTCDRDHHRKPNSRETPLVLTAHGPVAYYAIYLLIFQRGPWPRRPRTTKPARWSSLRKLQPPRMPNSSERSSRCRSNSSTSPPSTAKGDSNCSAAAAAGRCGCRKHRDWWAMSFDFRQQLLHRYRELARREIALGRHRRAAYIYAELLDDWNSAAHTLRDGGHHRAAAVYRERLGRPADAAKGLESAGLYIEAIECYEATFELLGRATRRSRRAVRPRRDKPASRNTIQEPADSRCSRRGNSQPDRSNHFFVDRRDHFRRSGEVTRLILVAKFRTGVCFSAQRIAGRPDCRRIMAGQRNKKARRELADSRGPFVFCSW